MIKYINVGIMFSVFCFFNVAHAGLITLGDSLSGGTVDNFEAIMVINESDAYTNASGFSELITVNSFDFTVGSNRGQVTPFIVRINNAAANDFTIMAIGETRYSGTDYFSTGNFSFDFSLALSQFTLAAGDIIASGFLDADVDGTSAGSVIPYISGDSLFLTGSANDSGSGDLSQGIGHAPTFGTQVFVSGLSRDYSYNITADIKMITPDTNTTVPEPSTLAIFALGIISLASRRFKK